MASRAPQVWVVIAAYNEASVIASVVADVKDIAPSSSMMARPTRQVPLPLKQMVSWCDIPSI